MKDKIKLVATATGVFLLLTVFILVAADMIKGAAVAVDKEVIPYFEKSAQCKSLGGAYGSGVCFVNGKEVKLD